MACGCGCLDAISACLVSVEDCSTGGGLEIGVTPVVGGTPGDVLIVGGGGLLDQTTFNATPTLQDVYDNGGPDGQIILSAGAGGGINIIGLGGSAAANTASFVVALTTATATAGSGDVGGAVLLTAGTGAAAAGVSAAALGGAVTITSGIGGAAVAGANSAAGGAASFISGAGGAGSAARSGSNGGALNITGGIGGTSGASGSAVGGIGGVVTIVAGKGGGDSGGNGAGAGGSLSVTAGAGGDALTVAAAAGGALAIASGAGGAGAGAVAAAAGGTLTINGGNGGVVGAGAGAAGGAVTITGGNGTGAAANANVTLTPGVSAGAATGSIIVLANDSATNTALDLFTLTHTSSSTTTTSFGTSQLWKLENANGTSTSVARETVVFTDATNASEDVSYSVYLITAGSLSTTVPTFTITGVAGQTTTVNDAATNTTTDMLTLTHTTSGTAAASFGTGLLWNLENANGTSISAARVSLVWTDATNASEDSEYRVFCITGGTLPTTATWATNGTSGGTMFVTDAATATVTNLLTLDHRSSGTAAVGYGTGILFRGQDAGGTAGGDDMGVVSASWSTATAASEDSLINFQVRVAGAALATAATVSGGATGKITLTGSGTYTTVTNMNITTGAAAGTMAFNCSATVAVFKGVSASGSNATYAFTPAAHTGQATTAESSQWTYATATKTWANGAITTQREIRWTPGTMAFASGTNIVTNAVAFSITAGIIAGTSAQFTNSVVFQVGGATAIGKSAAGMTYSAIDVPAHTITVVSTAQVTSRGFSALSLGVVTIAADAAQTVDTSATLYIAGAPAQGSNVTLTAGYPLWIDAGTPRIDSTTANNTVACVFTAASGPTGANTAIQEWLTININGTVRFIPCW